MPETVSTADKALSSRKKTYDYISSYVIRFLNRGDDRSRKAKKNAVFSLIFRGMDIATGLALVPLSLNFLDPQRYGIWLTIESIVAWFIILDVGLGNGLRNKFAAAYAQNNVSEAKAYISTAYMIIGLISGIFIISLIVANHFISWSSVLNAPSDLHNEIGILITVVFSAFAIRLALNLINMLWVAIQYPAVQHFVEALSKVCTLIVLIVLYQTVEGSLLFLASAYMLPPVVLFSILTVFTFKRKLEAFRPSFQSIDLGFAGSLMHLGIKFFIIQLGYIILVMTDNLIISHLYGPASVTPYQVAHKYFGLSSILFLILLSPMWSATTEAFTKGDYQWIERVVKRYKTIRNYLVPAVLVMLVISPWVYKLWIGDKVFIPFSLSACWALFIIVQCSNAIYTHVINGFGFLQIQLIGALFTIIANIPLSIFFAKNLHLGPQGVLLASVVSFLFYLVTRSIQYHKIIHRKAEGIWIK